MNKHRVVSTETLGELFLSSIIVCFTESVSTKYRLVYMDDMGQQLLISIKVFSMNSVLNKPSCSFYGIFETIIFSSIIVCSTGVFWTKHRVVSMEHLGQSFLSSVMAFYKESVLNKQTSCGFYGTFGIAIFEFYEFSRYFRTEVFRLVPINIFFI